MEQFCTSYWSDLQTCKPKPWSFLQESKSKILFRACTQLWTPLNKLWVKWGLLQALEVLNTGRKHVGQFVSAKPLHSVICHGTCGKRYLNAWSPVNFMITYWQKMSKGVVKNMYQYLKYFYNPSPSTSQNNLSLLESFCPYYLYWGP